MPATAIRAAAMWPLAALPLQPLERLMPKRLGTPGNMTVRSKPPSGQEGFFGKPRRWKKCPMPNGKACVMAAHAVASKSSRTRIPARSFHPCFLQAARCRAVCLQGLCESFGPGSGLRPAYPGERSHPELAAAELRLPAGRGGARSLLVASVDFRRSRYRSPSGRIGARQGAGDEDEVADADLEDHIVQWPTLLPKRARLKKPPQS